MKKLFSIIFSLLTTAFVFGESLHPSQYTFELISKNSGFTYSEIRSMITDKDNMLWFCCDNGLYFYDNYAFTHYKHKDGDITSLPSNEVNSVFYDSTNRLWVLTNQGICYYNQKKDYFEQVKFDGVKYHSAALMIEYDNSKYLTVIDNELVIFTKSEVNRSNKIDVSFGSTISCLYKENENDEIYIGLTNGELYITDKELKEFKLIHSETKCEIKAICKNDGKIYIGYLGEGLDVIDNHKNNITHYREDAKMNPIENNYIKTIDKRLNGDIWIGTGSGIVVFSPSGITTIISNKDNNLTRNSIYSIHVDAQDAVWVGTWAGSISYYNQNNYRFKSNLGNSAQLGENRGMGMVYHFATNNENTTWVAGEWSGLSLHNHALNKHVRRFGQNLHIKTLAREDNGDLWIGTIMQGLYRMDSKTKKISKIEIPNTFRKSSIISDIAIDEKRDLVWVGSRGQGLLCYNKSTKKNHLYNSSTTVDYVANDIWALKIINDDLLVCSDKGLSVCNKDGKYTNYTFENKRTSNNIAYSICQPQDSKDVYVGTKEHGVQVFNLDTKRLSEFTANTTLRDVTIYDIVCDNRNRLWISSNNGIYMYNIQSKTLKNFTKTDGLNSLQFHPGASTINDNGIVYFSSTTGFNYIDTKRFNEDEIAPTTHISSIYINNKSINDFNCKSIDSKHLTDATKIELTHNFNSITFNITSNNTLKSEKCKFKYCLTGYQNEWIYIDSNTIDFTRLPFGNYKLVMASCNSDGVWGETSQVDIKIHAPIYLQWYAILLYIVIIILLCYYVIKEAAFKIKMTKEIEIEKQTNIISTRSFDEKVKFFMNISHELRTPLSLIKAPLNMLEQELSSHDSMYHVKAIKRNTEQLLKLTNQILDFRLLEVGKLQPSITKFDIVKLCDEIIELFEYNIKERRINFTFEKAREKVDVSLDNDMINKVIYNLLTNALKYSEEEDSITLKIEERALVKGDKVSNGITKGAEVIGNATIISVEDTGCGIKANQLDKIFERFYFNHNEAYSSSGIGLHMCMEYTNLHKGNISVESQEGKGTKFTIVLPSDSLINEYSAPITTNLYRAESAPEQEVNTTINQHKATVLIADDNAEIRFYLKKLLSKSYNCISAKNGQQAYDLAADIKPDVIILDVLMPIMGGIDCALKLRAENSTKDIPIIMLTGLTDDNRVIQGVKAGADAYLAKPINELLLFTHIEHLITRSVEMKGKVAVEGNGGNIAPIASSKSFTQNIEAIMEQNIQNNMLDVNLIAQLMSVSRSTLHRNFKSELNMGASEYIREYRLRTAVKLMNSGVYNIDELASSVGFNSSSYFCKAFKDKYGVSPKKYYDSLKVGEK